MICVGFDFYNYGYVVQTIQTTHLLPLLSFSSLSKKTSGKVTLWYLFLFCLSIIMEFLLEVSLDPGMEPGFESGLESGQSCLELGLESGLEPSLESGLEPGMLSGQSCLEPGLEAALELVVESAMWTRPEIQEVKIFSSGRKERLTSLSSS